MVETPSAAAANAIIGSSAATRVSCCHQGISLLNAGRAWVGALHYKTSISTQVLWRKQNRADRQQVTHNVS